MKRDQSFQCIAVTMRLTTAIGMFACGSLWAQSPVEKDTDDQPDRYSEVIKDGLRYVRAAGNHWIDKRGCVSCHQVPTLIWSHQQAITNEVIPQVDELATWKSWSTEVVNFAKPGQKATLDLGETKAANIDTMVALLLAIPQNSKSQWRQGFVDTLLSEQAENGSWRACGQLPMQRRPKPETAAVTTLWTAYALMQEGVDFRVDSAVAFADQVSDARSSEWWAVRMLVAHRQGDPSIQRFSQRLRESQNEDGGWGWRLDEPSDALGTGYVLYAMAVIGESPEMVFAAKEFLADTQEESGRWRVPGTKVSASGKPTSTAIDWGTAWALIALAESQK